jgi:hypothetical protein
MQRGMQALTLSPQLLPAQVTPGQGRFKTAAANLSTVSKQRPTADTLGTQPHQHPSVAGASRHRGMSTAADALTGHGAGQLLFHEPPLDAYAAASARHSGLYTIVSPGRSTTLSVCYDMIPQPSVLTSAASSSS